MKTKIISIICVISLIFAVIPNFGTWANAYAMSDWVPISEAPFNTPVLEEKWTYTMQTFWDVDSRNEEGNAEALENDFTLIDSEWCELPASDANSHGSKKYTTSAPSDTHFSSWSKEPYEEWETETEKCVVTNTAGYIYWHYTYAIAGANRTDTLKSGLTRIISPKKTDFYNKWNCFFSTVNYPACSDKKNASGTATNYNVKSGYQSGEVKLSVEGNLRFYRFSCGLSEFAVYYKLNHYSKTEELESDFEVLEGETVESGSERIVISDVVHMVCYQDTYVISFDANGGSDAPDPITMELGETAILPWETPERAGRTFLGWSASRTASTATYFAEGNYSGNSDITLYAVWGDPADMCGSNLTWSFESSTGTLSIVGTSKMDDYDSENPAPWDSFKTEISKISIAEGATSIGSYAFCGCTGITEIDLPRSVTTFGVHSFDGCTNLQRFSSPGAIRTVPGYAFYNCVSLNEVAFSRYCTIIEEHAFDGCSSLLSIEIPITVSTIGAGAFANCTSLCEISIPSRVSQISSGLFENDTSLEFVVIPGNVNKIRSAAFRGCTGLRTVTLAEGVTLIDYDAFYGCNHLQTITIPDSVGIINESAFFRVNVDGNALTIRCYEDTLAHQYAVNQGFNYQLMSWEQLDAPTFVRRELGESVSVEIACSRGTIHYTTDGTDPDASSLVYSAPIAITKNTQIRAIAILEGWADSEVSVFDVQIVKVSKPYASEATGSCLQQGTFVSLFCDTEGAAIWYTTNGQIPTSANVYTAPFPVMENITVYAIAVKDGMITSNLAFFTYTVTNTDTVPEVITLAPTDITESTVKLAAQVESDDEVLAVQFVYYEKNNSRIKNYVNADANYTATLTGLTPNTEYWFQARAVNNVGWGSSYLNLFVTQNAENVKPTAVELDPAYISMSVGKTRTVLATVLPAFADNRDVVWSSENPDIAEVSQDGTVTALNTGRTRIVATTVSQHRTAYCTVEVSSRHITGLFDFSELNMITNCSNYYLEDYGFDYGWNDGGNALMASAYLSRWDGPVLEAMDPYPDSVTGIAYQEFDPSFHVQNIIYLPYREDANDNNEIKNAIMKYGAVYTSLKVNDKYFHSNEAYYYLPENTSGARHAVTIVGWDDNCSASNFADNYGHKPKGKGAFLCKNSWGTGSGMDGFFYVSYYDSGLGRSFGEGVTSDFNAVFCGLQNSDNYDKIYQYDYLGPVTGYRLGKAAYFSNVFPENGSALDEDEILEAVSFYCNSPGTSYEVYVVEDYQDPSDLKHLSEPAASGVQDYAGYFTVDLDEGVLLNAGTRFAVIVKQTPATGNTTIYLELPVEDYSSKASANADESYVSPDGKNWIDITTKYENANVCLKAFTSTSADTFSIQGVDNCTRAYSSDKVYTPEELSALGLIYNNPYADDTATLFEEEENYGYLAPTIMPDLKTSFDYSVASIFRKSYSLVWDGFVSPVKDQGNIGSCWSFATFASLESTTLKAAYTNDNCGEDGLSRATGTTDIELSKYEMILAEGNSAQLLATLYPLGSTDTIVWSSSDSSVAAVSAYGIVQAISTNGADYALVDIIASTLDGTISERCKVRVSKPAPLSGINLDSNADELLVGGKLLMDYELRPSIASDVDLIWEVSDETIASINQYGVLTGKRRGTVEVTAYSPDRSIQATHSVYIDDGLDYAADIVRNTVVVRNGSISGSISFAVENRTETDLPCQVIVAFYAPDGKFLGMETRQITLGANASSDVAIEDIMIPCEDNWQTLMKVIAIDDTGTYIPLMESNDKVIK